MRVLRVVHGGLTYYGSLLDDETVRLWTGPPWLGAEQTDRLVPLARTQRLAPVEPSKIVCVGRNYRAHAEELGNDVPEEPLLFLKPPSALLAAGEAIRLPPQSERVEHEGELGVVIGRRIFQATPEEAAEAIFGVTCANDVTARDLQRRDATFTRGKGFDTFCPCGPLVVTGLDTADLRIRVEVNGLTRQEGHTSHMIWPVPELLSYASHVMTLEAGDLICTGTPSGVGPLVAGDVVAVSVEGVGRLENPVESPEGTRRA